MKYKGEPFLSAMQFDVQDVALQCVKRFEPLRELPAPFIYFLIQKPLACIQIFDEERKPEICIHQVLNQESFPVEVFEYILLHELIHLLVVPRDVEGKHKSHPPEFWDVQKLVCPNNGFFYHYLKGTLLGVLKEDRKREGVSVGAKWKNIEYGRFLPLEKFASATGVELPVQDRGQDVSTLKLEAILSGYGQRFALRTSTVGEVSEDDDVNKFLCQARR